jgi:outer membrane protein assembly factor BamB
MPGWSNATPIIVGDRIFACCEPSTLVCLSLADGKILWQQANDYHSLLTPDQLAEAAENEKKAEPIRKKRESLQKQLQEAQKALRGSPKDQALKDKANRAKKEIAELVKQLEPLESLRKPRTQPVNGYSSPTPTSDGKSVFVLYGTGVAACYNLQGNRKWARIIEKPTNEWGHSASPLLIGDKLIVHVLGVTALDAQAGKTLWHADSAPAWGSPVHARIGQVDVVITPSGDIFKAEDGKALAKKVSGLEFCAPILHEQAAYFIEHGGKAVALPAKADGPDAPKALWQTKPTKDRYYASPVYNDGLIYAITQASIFSVIDAASGQVVYSRKLDLGKGTVFPSITFAGRHIYISGDAGITIVIEPGRQYRQVEVNRLEEFRSTPVFLGKRMYIRGLKHMYCIGQ